MPTTVVMAAASSDDMEVEDMQSPLPVAVSGPSEGIVPVHRCRFVQHTPAAIVSLAFGPPGRSAGTHRQPQQQQQRLLAVARANGNIELWNPRGQAWFHERTIPGSPDAPIESVVWVRPPARSSDDADPSARMNVGRAGTKTGNDNSDDDDDDDDAMGEAATARTHASRSLVNDKGAGDLRLFSAGLSGHIVEYDLATNMPLRQTDSYGGPIWCMAANHAQTHLAIGCEDGYIRIFRVPAARGEPIEFVSTAEKQPGRIMSLAWHPSDRFIVVGTAKSSLCKIALATGKSEHHMTLDKVRGEDTIAWDVKIVSPAAAASSHSGDSIVVADSLGYVTFWDWATGTLRKRIKAHGADALCLATDASGTRVYSSGVDRKVVELVLTDLAAPGAGAGGKGANAGNRLPGKRAPQTRKTWIIAGQKRYHSHDVRALLYISERPFDTLVSGGVDATLIFSSPVKSFNKLRQYRTPTFPLRSIVSIAASARLVLARFDGHAHIWRIGNVSQIDLVAPALLRDHQRLDHTPHQLLITLRFKGRTNLCASAISDDGRWAALSDAYTIKLYRIALNTESGHPIVKRVRRFPAPIPGAFTLAFTPDSRRLIVAGTDARVYIVGLDDGLDDVMPILAVFDHHAKGNMSTALSDVGMSMVQRQQLQPQTSSALADTDAATSSVSANHKVAAIFVRDNGCGTAMVCSLAVSADGLWLATGDIHNRIHIFNLDTLKIHATLPVFRFLHTSISFHPTLPMLIVPCTSNEFFLYDVEIGRLADWSRTHSQRLPKRFLSRRDTIMGATACRDRPNIIILWGPSYFAAVDINRPLGSRDDNLSVSESKRVHSDDYADPDSPWLKRLLMDGASSAASSGHPAEHVSTDTGSSKRTKKDPDANGNASDDQEDDDDDEDKTHQAMLNQSNNIGLLTTLADAHRRDNPLTGRHPRNRHRPHTITDTTTTTINATATTDSCNGIHIDHRYQAVMHMEYVGSELVVLERPILHVLAALPQAFYKHKYGT